MHEHDATLLDIIVGSVPELGGSWCPAGRVRLSLVRGRPVSLLVYFGGVKGRV